MRRRAAPDPALALAALAALSAAAFAGVAALVYSGRSRPADRRLRLALTRRRRRNAVVRRAAELVDPIGAPWGHGPAALLVAALLLARARRGRGPRARRARRGARAGAAAIVGASAAAALLSRGFERWIEPRQPPPGRHKPSEPSFPSGHALESAAVALAAGWVLSRERLAPGAALLPPLIAVPLVSAFAKLYLDRHWLSDAVGGWAAGIGVGATAAAAYVVGRKA